MIRIKKAIELKNGIIVSIQRSKHHYCNDDTYEVAAWMDGDRDFIRLGDDDDVIGYQTDKEVLAIIFKLNKI